MTKTNKLKGKIHLGQIQGWNALMYLSLSFSLLYFYKYSSSGLHNGFFPCFFLLLCMDLPFPLISSHKSSKSYTWKAEIVLLGLLSHMEHGNKLYPIILVVSPLFMVISSLIQPKEWLSCI